MFNYTDGLLGRILQVMHSIASSVLVFHTTHTLTHPLHWNPPSLELFQSSSTLSADHSLRSLYLLRALITLSHYHTVALSHCHTVTLTLYHTVTLSQTQLQAPSHSAPCTHTMLQFGLVVLKDH